MKQLPVRKENREAAKMRDFGEFVAELLRFTKDAERLGMHRVVLCLQYAYWEALCENAPPQTLDIVN